MLMESVILFCSSIIKYGLKIPKEAIVWAGTLSSLFNLVSLFVFNTLFEFLKSSNVFNNFLS